MWPLFLSFLPVLIGLLLLFHPHPCPLFLYFQGGKRQAGGKLRENQGKAPGGAPRPVAGKGEGKGEAGKGDVRARGPSSQTGSADESPNFGPHRWDNGGAPAGGISPSLCAASAPGWSDGWGRGGLKGLSPGDQALEPWSPESSVANVAARAAVGKSSLGEGDWTCGVRVDDDQISDDNGALRGDGGLERQQQQAAVVAAATQAAVAKEAAVVGATEVRRKAEADALSQTVWLTQFLAVGGGSHGGRLLGGVGQSSALAPDEAPRINQLAPHAEVKADDGGSLRTEATMVDEAEPSVPRSSPPPTPLVLKVTAAGGGARATFRGHLDKGAEAVAEATCLAKVGDG